MIRVDAAGQFLPVLAHMNLHVAACAAQAIFHSVVTAQVEYDVVKFALPTPINYQLAGGMIVTDN